jgi:hypothetical protein
MMMALLFYPPDVFTHKAPVVVLSPYVTLALPGAGVVYSNSFCHDFF